MSDEKKRAMREQGARVRAARAHKSGLTLDKLGEVLGVSGHTVWRIENGDRPLDLHEAELIAGATDVPLAFLLEGWATPQPEGALDEEVRALRKELDALATLVERSSEAYESRFSELSNAIQKRFAELAQRERERGQAPRGEAGQKRRRGDQNA